MAEGSYANRSGPGDRLRSLVVRLLRVPPPPEAPAGSRRSLRTVRPAQGFYRYLVARWALKQLGTLSGLVAGLVFLARFPDFPYPGLIRTAELLGVVGFVVQLPFTYNLVRLGFDYRWYLITDRSLRIREGIFSVREQTLSFANVQNLSIHQGPLQRLLGISDLRVRTAGGGGRSEGDGGSEGKGRDLHLGFLRGLESPEPIRDLILGHVRRLRDAGLGDLDDALETSVTGRGEPPAAGSAATSASLAAAGDLLIEARSLRAALRRPGGAGRLSSGAGPGA